VEQRLWDGALRASVDLRDSRRLAALRQRVEAIHFTSSVPPAALPPLREMHFSQRSQGRASHAMAASS
jgi:hypothetical protein